jgi:hypothetical protein
MLDMSPAYVDRAPHDGVGAPPPAVSAPRAVRRPSPLRLLAYALVIGAGLGAGLLIGVIIAIGSGRMDTMIC